MYMYIYIYVYRERGRFMCIYIYIYIYIYISQRVRYLGEVVVDGALPFLVRTACLVGRQDRKIV